MRLLELFEQSGNTAAVAFGRMNPPTIGHQKLVDAVLKQKADAHFLFVSQTHKSTGKNKTRLENPLPFDVKLGFIQQAFPNIDIGDTSVSTAIGLLQFLEKQGFDNVIFVGGSDRVASFTELFNNQNGVDYNLKSIKVVSSGSRDPDAEGADGMSASKMRAAAIANDFDAFKTGLPAGLSGDAEEIFAAVRQGLEPWLENDTSKKEDLDLKELADDDDYYKYILAKIKTGRPLSTREKEFYKTYTLFNKKTESSKIPFAGAKVGHKEGPAGQWRNKGPKANKSAKVGDLVGGGGS